MTVLSYGQYYKTMIPAYLEEEAPWQGQEQSKDSHGPGYQWLA